MSRVGLRKGERFISPGVQADAIRRWEVGSGARVLRLFEEFDESGGRADRPVLEHVLRRVEDGISAGVVVAKVDRFGRSLLAALAAIERVQRAGGRFVSVQDGLDANTDAGRLVLRIMLSMAEFELERYRTQFAEANGRAIARGTFTGSLVPVGYRKTTSGRLRPDPHTATS